MRIGVDATCWGNRRGYGRFTRELLEAVLSIDERNEYLFFLDSETADYETMPGSVRKLVAQTRQSPIRAASADGSRSLRDIWAMSREVMRHKIDLFFFPAVYSYFPVFNRARIVVTLHDMIADNHPALVFNSSKARFFWKLKQVAAVRQASLITTVSEYSKKQICEHFGLPESRLRVISEAARPVFRVIERSEEAGRVLADHGLVNGDRFVLYVGGISPHKNLARLVEAFGLLSGSRSDLKLVLVGDYQDDPFLSAYPTLRRQIAEMGLEGRVLFTGFAPDEKLAYLYNAAELLVFPSLEEGFGLPAIEAMSCGTPVAASNCGSLPEILGDAGVFFDPIDVRNIADTVGRVLADPGLRCSMRERGLVRSKRFRWQTAAEETLAVFEELAGRSPQYG